MKYGVLSKRLLTLLPPEKDTFITLIVYHVEGTGEPLVCFLFIIFLKNFFTVLNPIHFFCKRKTSSLLNLNWVPYLIAEPKTYSNYKLLLWIIMQKISLLYSTLYCDFIVQGIYLSMVDSARW